MKYCLCRLTLFFRTSMIDYFGKIDLTCIFSFSYLLMLENLKNLQASVFIYAHSFSQMEYYAPELH